MQPMASMGTIPVLNVQSAAQVDYQLEKQRADAQAEAMANGPATSQLLAHMQACLMEATNAKQANGVTDRLLDCQRRRKGEHTSVALAKITKYNLPNYWAPLTQTKCMHTEAWMRDLLIPYSDKIWSTGPSTIPDLPGDEKQAIDDKVVSELQEKATSGSLMFSPEEIETAVKEAIENAENDIRKEAKDKAKRMEDQILDNLEDCDFRTVFREFLSNVVTYGTGFLKGPFTKTVKMAKWNGKEREVESKIIPICSAPSPHDIFPSPWAKDEQDGYIIERIRTYRAALNGVRKVKYYQQKEIEALLTDRNQTPSIQYGDSERDTREDRGASKMDDRIECWSFSGPIAGYMLEGWGLTDIDSAEDYEVEVMWSNNRILKVMPNWNGTGVRPYFRAVFKPIVGSFWGIAVPNLMAGAQDRANSLQIAILDNAAWASGPIGFVDQTRLVNANDAKTIHPRKMFAVKTIPNAVGDPIKFVNVSMNVAELDRLYQQALTDADNESGVPAYMYGSDKAAGAGSTYSGLATLMNAAARGIKDALLEIDQAVSKFISNWADWLNEYSEDDSIKGDVKVICSGATGLFVQEMQLQRMGEMLDRLKSSGANEVIGPEFFIGIIRQMGKMLKMDVAKIPTDEEMEQKIKEATIVASQQVQPGGAPAMPQEQIAPQGQVL
jgi:hypothetical protein